MSLQPFQSFEVTLLRDFETDTGPVKKGSKAYGCRTPRGDVYLGEDPKVTVAFACNAVLDTDFDASPETRALLTTPSTHTPVADFQGYFTPRAIGRSF